MNSLRNDPRRLIGIPAIAGVLGILLFWAKEAPIPSHPARMVARALPERGQPCSLNLPMPAIEVEAAPFQERPGEIVPAEHELLQVLEAMDRRGDWFKPGLRPRTVEGIGSSGHSGEAFRARLRALLKESDSEVAVYNIASHLEFVGDLDDVDVLVSKLGSWELRPTSTGTVADGEVVVDRLLEALVHCAGDRTSSVLRQILEDDSLYLRMRASEHLLRIDSREAVRHLVDVASWDDSECYLRKTHQCLRWGCVFHHEFVKDRASDILDRVLRRNRSDDQTTPKGYSEWKAWAATKGQSLQIPDPLSRRQ